MRTKLRGKVTLLFIVCAALIAVPAVALADIITADPDAATVNVVEDNVGKVPGSTGTVKVWLTEQAPNQGDPVGGCNANDQNAVAITLSAPPNSDVTFDSTGTKANPASLNACGPAAGKEIGYAVSSNATNLPKTITVTASGSGGRVTGSASNPNIPVYNADTFTLTVKKATSITNVSGTGTEGGTATLKATLSSGTNDMSNKTVSFKLGSTAMGTDLTDSNGLAELSVNLPASYTASGSPYANEVSASFAGDTDYAAAGPVSGNLTVNPACTNPANPGFTNTPAASGWFNASTGIPTPNATTTTSGATVKYSLTENGTYSTTPPTLGQGETTVWAKAFSATGTCSSVAVSQLFKVDTIAPNVTPGNVVNSTWRNTDLSQAFTASDGGSGLAPDQGLDASNGFTLTASDESADANSPTVVSKTVSDVAGNSTTRSVSAKIDKTPPTISATRNPADPAASGWYNISTGALKLSYTCNDALSGVAGPCPGLHTFGEGNNLSHSETISDQAGNQATSAVNNIKVDLTKPSVSVTGVSNGTTYTTGNVPTPGCDTQDQPTLSGVKTNATVNVTGGTGGFGTLTATCSGAEDNAGNTNSASVTYGVKAAFNGFLQPIDGHAVNTGKFGRTYPIKWQLRDSSGALISDSAAQLLVGTITGGQKLVTCNNFTLEPEDALEESTTGNTSLRYDATSDQFIYNYKAPSSGGPCFVFAIRNADGLTTQQIDFKFTK